MKKRWVFLVLILALGLTSCEFLNSIFDPASELRGSWVIDLTKSSEIVPDSYYKFIVDSDDSYEVLDHSEAVLERGEMRELDEDSFEYTMVSYPADQSYEGSRNYAEWSVSGDTLSVSFYDDATKNTFFVEFVCTKR